MYHNPGEGKYPTETYEGVLGPHGNYGLSRLILGEGLYSTVRRVLDDDVDDLSNTRISLNKMT